MASETFHLHDPVYAETSSSTTSDDASATTSSSANTSLEGIIAHLGPVQFADGEWIGIRLTGPSLHQGRNSGTVKGIHYFDAGGEKNGLFVKKQNVRRRKLTKLEELRLRRELSEVGVVWNAGSGGAGSGIKSPKAPSSTSRIAPTASSTASGIISPKRTPVRSTASSGGAAEAKSAAARSASNDDGKSRLEQIRARREQLARERGKGVSSGGAGSGTGSSTIRSKSDATTNSNDGGDEDDDDDEAMSEQSENKDDSKNNDNESNNDKSSESESTTAASKINLQTATPAYRAELTRLQSQITTLQSSLKQKEAECKSLQSSLDFMSQGAEQTTHDAVRMYAMGALALTEAKTPGKGGGAGKGRLGGIGKSLEGDMDGDESGSGSDSDVESDEDGSDNDDDEDSNNNEDQVVSQAAAAVSKALVERNNELQSQLSNLNSQNSALKDQLSDAEEKITHMASKLETSMENYHMEKQMRAEDSRNYTADKSVMSSQISSLERELKILQERVSDKSSSQEHSHLTLAKLRAELTSYQRKNEELMNEKIDLESTLEEVILDKEQLREEKEMLEDQLEECKIDKESAELELEDVRSRLEEAETAGVGVIASASAAGLDTSVDSAVDGESSNADAQDVTRSLTLQNTRLRTAIIRLREQSELERNDLLRQLKTFQSDSSCKEELQTELEELRSTHASTLKEVQELKDVIDQTTELEQTIENLSDKVWMLEEENSSLQRTIRELEESAEIAAEMEEVQSEELKMMMRDLESRDALVRNLEEAIKMQRRREEDFQRYVSEFRTSISTLQREKASLLALTEGDQGEKSHLLAKSQKALAQAAQLAADAAEARKRDAEAAFDKIAARSASYLSQRLEMFLPSGVVSSELAAVKGEMLLAKMADKAAVSLTSVEDVFHKAIEKGMAGLSEFNVLEDGNKAILSESSSQQVATMVHQAEFASMTIEAASDALRLMAAGQWPELLSQDLSADLGSVVVHSIAHLDLALSEQLKLLKQEGVLSPLRSSLTDLDQSVRSTRLALFSATDETGKTVVPADWKPPGWEALKALSLGRFACLGATAVLSSAINPMENTDNEPPAPTLPNLAAVLEKAKQSCTTVLDVCKKLSGLRLEDADTMESLNELATEYNKNSAVLFDAIKTTFKQQSVAKEDVDNCAALLEEVLVVARKLAALMRKADLCDADAGKFHSLSPEYGDAWGGVTQVASQVRGVDGDSEDVNYLMRARAIEQQLADAVQNEPKLVISNAKVASLEKSLSSRSKEIAMQNARIAELESLIAKSSSSPMTPLKGSTAGGPSSPSPDIHKLREEVRVLQEALDVTQQQADEYEKEIKALKDKSRPSRVRQSVGGRTTPKSKNAMDIEATLSQLSQPSGSKAAGSSSRDILLESISLETALFRPALATANQSANYWKAQAMGSALAKLAPLNVSVKAQSSPSSMGDEARKLVDELVNKRSNETVRRLEQVSLASNEVRLAKASFSIVDLTKIDVPARAQLMKERQRGMTAELRLKDATSTWLSTKSKEVSAQLSSGVSRTIQEEPCGRITLPCRENIGFVAPMTVDNVELRNLHSFLVQ